MRAKFFLFDIFKPRAKKPVRRIDLKEMFDEDERKQRILEREAACKQEDADLESNPQNTADLEYFM